MRSTDIDPHAYRTPEHPVADLIIERWSPRAMSGESLAEEELMALFEAARWAPSSFNDQHWRFLYATCNSPYWNLFFDLLAQPNQLWADKASALVLIVSRTRYEKNDKPTKTHSFSTGAAWQNLALEGSRRGLVVHGMEGFDYKQAREQLNVPDVFAIEAMVAIGKPGQVEALPASFQDGEQPSDRKPLSELVCEGPFPEQ